MGRRCRDARSARGHRGLGGPDRLDRGGSAVRAVRRDRRLPAGAMLGADRWGDSVTVVRAYGDTPLRDGDVVSGVDGRSIAEWVTIRRRPRARLATSSVHGGPSGRRAGPEQVIEVPLTRYPLPTVAYRNLGTLVLVGMPLAAATLVFWRRPRSPVARAFLVATALVPAVLTSWPFGLGVIDLAGSRGIWPHLTGEALCAVGIGTLLLTALLFLSRAVRPPGRWSLLVAYGVPLVGYVAWALRSPSGSSPPPHGCRAYHGRRARPWRRRCRWRWPSCSPATCGHRRAQDRLAARLVLLALVGGLGVRLLLGRRPAPDHRRARCVPVADPGAAARPGGARPAWSSRCCATGSTRSSRRCAAPWCRRWSWRWSGAAFVAVAGAVNLASGHVVRVDGRRRCGGAARCSRCASRCNRWLRRLVYGDRDFRAPGRRPSCAGWTR